MNLLINEETLLLPIYQMKSLLVINLVKEHKQKKKIELQIGIIKNCKKVSDETNL